MQILVIDRILTNIGERSKILGRFGLGHSERIAEESRQLKMLPELHARKENQIEIESISKMPKYSEQVIGEHVADKWFPGKDMDRRIVVDRKSGIVYVHISLGERQSPYPTVHLIINPDNKVVSIDGHDLYSRENFSGYSQQPYPIGADPGPSPGRYAELSNDLTRKLMAYTAEYGGEVARTLHWGSKTTAQEFRYLSGGSPEGAGIHFPALQ